MQARPKRQARPKQQSKPLDCWSLSRAVIALLAAGVIGTGCSVPALRLHAEPAGTRLAVDGRVLPSNEATVPVPYYGTIAVGALPPSPLDHANTLQWRPHFEGVRVSAPAYPWLFPLDFLAEVVTAPWRETDIEVHVAADPRPQLVSGVHPARANELRERAWRARTAR